jgi:flagellar basal body-associated protein FliL
MTDQQNSKSAGKRALSVVAMTVIAVAVAVAIITAAFATGISASHQPNLTQKFCAEAKRIQANSEPEPAKMEKIAGAFTTLRSMVSAKELLAPPQQCLREYEAELQNRNELRFGN